MTRVASAAPPALIDPPAPKTPYRGIEPFRFVDQKIFAEREDEQWELMRLVTLYRGVMLYGESGAGKSSLIDAGIIPAALREGYIPDRLRVQLKPGEEFVVERVSSSEQGPAGYLPSTLVEGEGGEARVVYSIEEFKERLAAHGPPGGGRPTPLLIFDQFEELITTYEEAEDRPAALKAGRTRQRIIDALVKLLQDEASCVRLLFVFREDYLAKLNILFDLYPNLIDQSYFLHPPRTDKLVHIIRAPFTKNPRAYPKQLSLDLANELAAKMRGGAGGETINLTELQIVCLKLWESPDPQARFAETEPGVLLADYFEGELAKTGDLRDTAIAILSRLVTGANTRNILSEEELLGGAQAGEGVTREQAEAALDALVETKMVRRELRHNIRVCEIASEFLVPAIALKKQQIEAERKVQDELGRARREAERAKRRARRQLQLFALFALVVALAIISYWQVTKAWREMRRQREIAEEAKSTNRQMVEMFLLLASDKEEDKRKGLEMIQQFSSTNAIPRELSFALLSTVSDSTGEVSEGASRLVGQAASGDPLLAEMIQSAAKTDDALAEKLPPRVTIFFPTEEQRGDSVNIKRQLERSGYVVPKIGQVDYYSAPGRSQLRYFIETDADKAKGAAGAVRGFGVPVSAEKAPTPSGSVVRPGQFELWLARSPVQAGSQWFVRVKFFAGASTRETLEAVAGPIAASRPGAELKFPQSGVARLGPYENEEEAAQIRDRLKEGLKNTGLRRVSIAIYPRKPEASP